MSDAIAPYTAADLVRFAHTVPSTMTLPELERQLLDKRVSGFPVVDEGKLVGIVSRSDIVRQLCVERKLAQTTSDFYLDSDGFHEHPLESFEEIADRVGERIEELTVRDVMIQTPHFIETTMTLDKIAAKLVDLRIHRLLVIDQGQLAGIVTSTDLVRLIAEKKLLRR